MMRNREKDPRSAVSLVAGVALILGVTGGAVAYAFNGGASGPEGTPTPEQLQNQTGHQVYVVPDSISNSPHEVDIGEAKDFCIRIGSVPQTKVEALGFNPLEGWCDTHGSHDAYYSALSKGDLLQACANAGGKFAFVRVDGDYKEACETDIPVVPS